jgi:hypothetical protein
LVRKFWTVSCVAVGRYEGGEAVWNASALCQTCLVHSQQYSNIFTSIWCTKKSHSIKGGLKKLEGKIDHIGFYNEKRNSPSLTIHILHAFIYRRIYNIWLIVQLPNAYHPIRHKKNTCGSGFRPTLFFSADPIIFSTRLTVRPYFLQVCCLLSH